MKFKKIIGYILILFGLFCFLIVGGGSGRYSYGGPNWWSSYTDLIYLILFYLLTPVIGYFSMKIGFKVLEKNQKE